MTATHGAMRFVQFADGTLATTATAEHGADHA